jgi:hypothetical protein
MLSVVSSAGAQLSSNSLSKLNFPFGSIMISVVPFLAAITICGVIYLGGQKWRKKRKKKFDLDFSPPKCSQALKKIFLNQQEGAGGSAP